MTKFEYIVELEYQRHLATDWLNKRGQDGWELIAVVPDKDVNGTELLRYYFKREIHE